MNNQVLNIIEKYNKDHTRLMDILIDVQDEAGCVDQDAVLKIAKEIGISVVDVEQTLSFYHFFSSEPRGKYTVYLNNSAVAVMMGRDTIARVFEEESGCSFNSVTGDGLIGLFDTACIGMNDQEPAAIINNEIFPRLTTRKVRQIVKGMLEGRTIEELKGNDFGDGANGHELVRSQVRNNIKRKGPVLEDGYTVGSVIRDNLTKMSPGDVIKTIKESNIRGRGGAGFPTGMKWDFCRRAEGNQKYIFCNADEGEPGTFKDRVVLTEAPGLIIEGMVVAGYAVGASEGLLYVRHEYKYLVKYLNKIMDDMRADGLLGKDIAGITDFNFDVRIQLGAGAYVCGEESALIESAEGKRGEPRDRPPFPVQAGYLDKPTVVNNVETLCLAVKILKNGPAWFMNQGTEDSTGTKILSISGDCKEAGVYEVTWGFTVNDVLRTVEAEQVQAVQVGGPSGALIGPEEFDRVLCYSDLSTGGSIMIFDENRDLLKDVVMNFLDFFIEESCGSCSTCRILPVLMKQKMEKILEGHGTEQDIEDLIEWAMPLEYSRCGLGQTAANPVLTSIKNLRNLYERKVKKDVEFDTGFDLHKAIREGSDAAGRIPIAH
ncbi:MAG: NAD(P)H-dependent oxidoreductase subunit E [Bacteroidales bacterium]